MRRIAVSLIAVAMTLMACSLGGDGGNDNKNESSENQNINKKVEISYQSIALPIESRSFLIGTAGYSPPDFPNLSLDQVNQYWYEVNQSGETYGVHVDWEDTNVLKASSASFNGDIILVLGFQNPEQWLDSQDQFEEEVLQLLSENPKVKYLAIGNEVNDLYSKYPDQFPNFVTAYKRFYQKLKQEHPDLQVFTTFQYEWLLGEGALTGRALQSDPQWEVLTLFEGYNDIVGITLYPYFDYATPDQIPSDYLSRISQYSDKPILITETSWISRESFFGANSALNSTGYIGSQQEQADYLLRLIDLAQGSEIVAIDWLFLNDPFDWQNSENSGALQIFESSGLKNYNGEQKIVWDYWLSLKDVPYEKSEIK